LLCIAGQECRGEKKRWGPLSFNLPPFFPLSDRRPAQPWAPAGSERGPFSMGWGTLGGALASMA
jgi:hypothetical protein